MDPATSPLPSQNSSTLQVLLKWMEFMRGASKQKKSPRPSPQAPTAADVIHLMSLLFPSLKIPRYNLKPRFRSQHIDNWALCLQLLADRCPSFLPPGSISPVALADASPAELDSLLWVLAQASTIDSLLTHLQHALDHPSTPDGNVPDGNAPDGNAPDSNPPASPHPAAQFPDRKTPIGSSPMKRHPSLALFSNASPSSPSSSPSSPSSPSSIGRRSNVSFSSAALEHRPPSLTRSASLRGVQTKRQLFDWCRANLPSFSLLEQEQVHSVAALFRRPALLVAVLGGHVQHSGREFSISHLVISPLESKQQTLAEILDYLHHAWNVPLLLDPSALFASPHPDERPLVLYLSLAILALEGLPLRPHPVKKSNSRLFDKLLPASIVHHDEPPAPEPVAPSLSGNSLAASPPPLVNLSASLKRSHTKDQITSPNNNNNNNNNHNNDNDHDNSVIHTMNTHSSSSSSSNHNNNHHIIHNTSETSDLTIDTLSMAAQIISPDCLGVSPRLSHRANHAAKHPSPDATKHPSPNARSSSPRGDPLLLARQAIVGRPRARSDCVRPQPHVVTKACLPPSALHSHASPHADEAVPREPRKKLRNQRAKKSSHSPPPSAFSYNFMQLNASMGSAPTKTSSSSPSASSRISDRDVRFHASSPAEDPLVAAHPHLATVTSEWTALCARFSLQSRHYQEEEEAGPLQAPVGRRHSCDQLSMEELSSRLPRTLHQQIFPSLSMDKHAISERLIALSQAEPTDAADGRFRLSSRERDLALEKIESCCKEYYESAFSETTESISKMRAAAAKLISLLTSFRTNDSEIRWEAMAKKISKILQHCSILPTSARDTTLNPLLDSALALFSSHSATEYSSASSKLSANLIDFLEVLDKLSNLLPQAQAHSSMSFGSFESAIQTINLLEVHTLDDQLDPQEIRKLVSQLKNILNNQKK